MTPREIPQADDDERELPSLESLFPPQTDQPDVTRLALIEESKESGARRRVAKFVLGASIFLLPILVIAYCAKPSATAYSSFGPVVVMILGSVLLFLTGIYFYSKVDRPRDNLAFVDGPGVSAEHIQAIHSALRSTARERRLIRLNARNLLAGGNGRVVLISRPLRPVRLFPPLDTPFEATPLDEFFPEPWAGSQEADDVGEPEFMDPDTADSEPTAAIRRTWAGWLNRNVWGLVGILFIVAIMATCVGGAIMLLVNAVRGLLERRLNVSAWVVMIMVAWWVGAFLMRGFRRRVWLIAPSALIYRSAEFWQQRSHVRLFTRQNSSLLIQVGQNETTLFVADRESSMVVRSDCLTVEGVLAAWRSPIGPPRIGHESDVA